jgi:hypothetical protein
MMGSAGLGGSTKAGRGGGFGTNCGAGGGGGTGGGDAANGVLGVAMSCVELGVVDCETGGCAGTCTCTKLSSDPVEGLSLPFVMSIDDEPLAQKCFPLGDLS